MGAAPRVTVLVPVYNRAPVLRQALESVLAQRFADFELLVIDDGSRDGSLEIARSLRDPRIRIEVQAQNRGIPATRNHGLALARGEYLAMADSDDVSHPRRLALQVPWLDAHPEVAALGSFALRTDASGRRVDAPLVRPTAPRELAGRILFASAMKSPTVVARTAVLREHGYREELVLGSDIDLWARVSARHALANLPRFLVRYRAGGVSHEDGALRLAMRRLVASPLLDELGVPFADADLDRHAQLRNLRGFHPDAAYLAWCEGWLERLVEANARVRRYPEPEFRRAAAERSLLVSLRATAAGEAPRALLPLLRSLGRVFGGAPGYARLGLGALCGAARALV
ncbi:MAG TPA: glycosyltransferase family 2 protein [Myxococcota bacterium]|nr:glycosyltransferase family 2 protein [Myxococcota bacterium]